MPGRRSVRAVALVRHLTKAWAVRVDGFCCSSPDEKVEPIPAGARDSFRVILLGRDIPHFDSYRVRVLESAPVASRAD